VISKRQLDGNAGATISGAGFFVGRSGAGRSEAAAGVPQSPARTASAAKVRISPPPGPAVGRSVDGAVQASLAARSAPDSTALACLGWNGAAGNRGRRCGTPDVRSRASGSALERARQIGSPIVPFSPLPTWASIDRMKSGARKRAHALPSATSATIALPSALATTALSPGGSCREIGGIAT